MNIVPNELVDRIATELSELKGSGKPQESWGHPVLDVLDCVLSLNRQYDEFAKPRVEGFARRYPEVKSLQDLASMISKKGQIAFMVQALDYKDKARAKVLAGVVD